MNGRTRQSALAILTNPDGQPWLAVHNAVVDLRRNAQAGDETLLRGLLNFPNDMVVSASLYALVNVYDQIPELLQLLLHFADGDDRDNGEMPIQTQAVEGLAIYSRKNPEALTKLLSVAKCSSTPEAPRARAWKCLADLFGVYWQREYTAAMIWDPESETSESIRQSVLSEIEERKGIPLPN